MNKGIVMKKTLHHLIVMQPDGQFIKLPLRGQTCQVGEEIQFSTPRARWKGSYLTVTSRLAAAVFLVLIAFLGLSNFVGSDNHVAAYVTVDINPSVEFGIDADEVVIEAQGLNEDGEKLLKHVKFKGKKLEEVSTELMIQANEQHYLNPYIEAHEGSIVITSTVMNEDVQFTDEEVTAKVKKSVERVLQDKHPQQSEEFVVSTLPAPKELREEARNKGVSAGKLAIELLSKDQGNPISSEDLKDLSIHEAAKKMGGIGQIMRSDSAETKEKLKDLLQQLQREEDSAEQRDDKKPNRSESNHKGQSDKDKKDKNDKNDKNGENDKNKDRDQDSEEGGKEDKEQDKDIPRIKKELEDILKNKDPGSGKSNNHGNNEAREDHEDNPNQDNTKGRSQKKEKDDHGDRNQRDERDDGNGQDKKDEADKKEGKDRFQDEQLESLDVLGQVEENIGINERESIFKWLQR
jgi:hypothetical protein